MHLFSNCYIRNNDILENCKRYISRMKLMWKKNAAWKYKIIIKYVIIIIEPFPIILYYRTKLSDSIEYNFILLWIRTNINKSMYFLKTEGIFEPDWYLTHFPIHIPNLINKFICVWNRSFRSSILDSFFFVFYIIYKYIIFINYIKLRTNRSNKNNQIFTKYIYQTMQHKG